MTALREKMTKAMQLRGLALSTQESYQLPAFSPTAFCRPCRGRSEADLRHVERGAERGRGGALFISFISFILA